jgi:4-diphosphocytidyl-2C-methyl-D-erythritol kinase
LLEAFTIQGPRAAGAAGLCINDLEAPSFSIMPLLADLKAFLFQEGCTGVMMSGSGAPDAHTRVN